MTCAQIQDELLLYMGDELPDELKAHVAGCSECRERWEELSALASTLGSDRDFAPDPHTALVIEGHVLRQTVEDGKPSEWSFGAIAKIAAAVVLVAGSSFVSYRVGQQLGTSTVVDTAVPYADSGEYTVADTAQVDIDEGTISLLIDDFAATVSEPGERLLDDLTAEEMEYLEKNFKSEDLL